MGRRRRPIRFGGVLVGVAATLVVAALEAGGAFRDFELWLLDKRFVYCNRLGASDAVVHIDITDDSLERIGRWPWHRRLHADLVRTLKELGARYIVFDIEFSEPTDPRLPGGADEVETVYSADDLIYDDDELAAAIREAGNVFLPVSFEIREPGRHDAALRRRAADLLSDRPDIDGRSFAEALGLPPKQGPALLARARLAGLLRQDFSLTAADMSSRLGLSGDEVDRYLAGVKRDVARELAAEHLWHLPCERLSEPISDPAAAMNDFVEAVLADVSGASSLDVEDLRRAFVRTLSERVVSCRCEPIPQDLPTVPVAGSLTPPWYSIAAGAAGFGFVAFDADADGVVRRTPLRVRYGDGLIPQLGYAVAQRLLGAEGQHPAIPLDAEGKCLIVWQTAPARWNAEANNFRHIQVGRVLEIPLSRRQMSSNQAVLGEAWARLVEALAGPGENEQYRELVRTRNRLLRANPGADIDELQTRIRAIEQKQFEFFAQSWPPADELTPRDEHERRQFALYDELHESLVRGGLRTRIDEANAHLGDQVTARLAELRSIIEGRVCLIGYTATAVADMKPTAIFPLAPGVIVHSNVINQTLAGRSIRPPPAWEDLLLVGVAGAGIAVVTALLGPYVSLLTMLGLQGVCAVGNGVLLFAWLGIWAAAAGPMIAVTTSWAAVTLYRQLTEERKKRQFASALSQYVSQAVARRIADDIYDLSPVASEVTCFFSDLKGFTSISERLGPAGTRDLLNPYLEAMSGVLQRHGALINKFIGDGIFAFFNPPIWPCPDHAAAACRSALASQEALRQLNQRLHLSGNTSDSLSMRIGISTGPVFVGDYGSETKRDYTCIGDTINLGARLEAANKAFGSSVMVAETTQRFVAEQFEFRYLGRLQVVGKARAVGVYELLGRKGDVHEHHLEAARRFAAAAEAFARRNWDEAGQHFAAYLELCPNDPGAARYVALIDRYRRTPPPDDWSGVVVLEEK